MTRPIDELNEAINVLENRGGGVWITYELIYRLLLAAWDEEWDAEHYWAEQGKDLRGPAKLVGTNMAALDIARYVNTQENE